MNQLRPALASFVLLTVLTGVVYPLLVTGVAQVAFPTQANGSLLVSGGKAVGSTLIGQPFDDPKYFWSRLSATSPSSYNTAASSGSNLGPTSRRLRERIAAEAERLRAGNPRAPGGIPIDLVTASASGLDPHISPAAAGYQLRRVARVRGLPVPTVEALVGRNTHGRQWGFLGEPVVDVLALNVALDELAPE